MGSLEELRPYSETSLGASNGDSTQELTDGCEVALILRERSELPRVMEALVQFPLVYQSLMVRAELLVRKEGKG